MRLALLFWFYGQPDLCAERLALLRRLNPGVAIFGLYGGPPGEAAAARAGTAGLLDDFYAFPEVRPGAWKWRHGDRLIAAWHRERGRALAWDTVLVVQWDLLMLAPAARLFAALAPGEALFSGFRPAAEVAGWWGWLDPEDAEKRRDRNAFVAELARTHGYGGPLWCCLFIVAALPRGFLDRFAAAPPAHGFLEYTLPTLARAWEIPVNTTIPVRPWWRSDPATRAAPQRERLLNAVGEDVPLALVLEELADPRGQRLVHPFRRRFPAWLHRPALARLAALWLRRTGRPPWREAA